MDKQELFTDLLDHAETFGELPAIHEDLTMKEYLRLLTSEMKAELDDAMSSYAEQAWENRLNNFYGSSEPVTITEQHKKAFDTKQKLG